MNRMAEIRCKAWKIYRNRLMTLQDDAFTNLHSAAREIADDPTLAATPLCDHMRQMAVQHSVIKTLLERVKKTSEEHSLLYVRTMLTNGMTDSSMDFVRTHDRASEDKIRIFHDLLKLMDAANEEAR